MEKIFPYFNDTAPEISMVNLYTSMWTSFIGTGKPVPEDGAFSHITWDRFVPEQNNYLEINANPAMKTGLYPDRMEEWEKLFPLSLVSHVIKDD